MKQIVIIVMLFVNISCSAQKMVETPSDAKKLQDNEQLFIGKTLGELLTQIKPSIKLVYGNPENTWPNAPGGTSLTFSFMEAKDYKKLDSPLHVWVVFYTEVGSKRKPLPKGGLSSWGKDEMKEYGDMIIRKIRVSGKL